MTFNRWLALIGILTALGLAKTAQQTAIWLAAYELGDRAVKLHDLENETLWLKTKVVSLQSPTHLAKAMAAQPAQLVAWSALPSESEVVRVAQVGEVAFEGQLSD